MAVKMLQRRDPGTTLFRMTLVVLGWAYLASVVAAADKPCCAHCGANGCKLVECTIMVPITVTETRVQNCIVKKNIEREETYTVFRRVAEKREFKKKICYLDKEVKSKEITEKTCHIVNNPVVKTYRVNVPVCETVTEMVEAEECIDGELVVVERSVTKNVVREREEVRTKKCEEPQVVYETTKRTIDYCVKVPKTKEVPCSEETVYKLVPETRTRKVTACVPTLVRKPIEVKVCKQFPKTIYRCRACSQQHGGCQKCGAQGCSSCGGK